MKSIMKKSICLLGLALIAGGVCWAAEAVIVSSQPVSLGAAHDFPIMIPLKLTSAQAVAGINGQLDFDANLFSNPQIQKGVPTQNFNVLGNQVSAGHYKFVVYADPTASMSLKDPVVFFRIQVSSNATHSAISTMSFSEAASSSPAALSLTTAFANIQVNLLGNAAKDWAIYN
jgi:hypothetical protein